MLRPLRDEAPSTAPPVSGGGQLRPLEMLLLLLATLLAELSERRRADAEPAVAACSIVMLDRPLSLPSCAPLPE